MSTQKLEEETVTVQVTIPKKYHTFLDTLARLRGQAGIEEMLRTLALEEAAYMVNGGSDPLGDAAVHLGLNFKEEVPDV